MKLRHMAVGASAVASLVAALSAQAECVAHPAVRAKARLLSCHSFTVEPSPLKESDFDPKLTGERADFRRDNPKRPFHGTLLMVQFEEAFGAAQEGQRAWKAGGIATLFTSQPASQVCSPQGFSQVVTDDYCCDVFPSGGSCLVSGLERVFVNPSAKQLERFDKQHYFSSGLGD